MLKSSELWKNVHPTLESILENRSSHFFWVMTSSLSSFFRSSSTSLLSVEKPSIRVFYVSHHILEAGMRLLLHLNVPLNQLPDGVLLKHLSQIARLGKMFYSVTSDQFDWWGQTSCRNPPCKWAVFSRTASTVSIKWPENKDSSLLSLILSSPPFRELGPTFEKGKEDNFRFCERLEIRCLSAPWTSFSRRHEMEFGWTFSVSREFSSLSFCNSTLSLSVVRIESSSSANSRRLCSNFFCRVLFTSSSSFRRRRMVRFNASGSGFSSYRRGRG